MNITSTAQQSKKLSKMKPKYLGDLKMAEQSYEAPTWNQVCCMLQNQAKRICQSGFHPEVIVGVCRGGWVPARILSDLLCTPCLASVKVECYKGTSKSEKGAVLTQCVSADVTDKLVLVVDDVSDSGKTLQIVAKHLKTKGAREVRTATLYYKPFSALSPDFFEKQADKWVIFPWDAKESIRAILEPYKAVPAELDTRIRMLVEADVPKCLVIKFAREFKEDKPC